MKLRLNITPKEQQILALIAQEYSTNEIATRMKIASKTVENHRYSIAKKLNLSGNNCVLIFALAHKQKLLKRNSG